MTNAKQPNLFFAQALIQVLAEHHLKLEQLPEFIDLSPDRLQHLQRALQSSKQAALLSLAEQEQLEAALSLNDAEQGRLQAALLATAVWHTLREQLGNAYAQQLTEQMYPQLLDIYLHTDLNAIRDRERGQAHDSNEDTETDMAWKTIDAAMNSAHLATQLSRTIAGSGEKIRRLQEAQAYLDRALEELDDLDEAIKMLPIWQTSYQRAKSERSSVLTRMRILGKKQK